MSQTLKQLSNSQRNVDHPPLFVGDADSSELLHQLDNWVSRGWLRALDRSFATFILEQDPQAQASVLLAAAMTSHQLGRGHSCLDLVATLQAPDFVLSLPPEGEEGGQLPSQWLLGLDVAQWRRALCLSTMVEDRDEPQRFPERPLVLTGQRLYLRRYWNYERSIAQALSARLSVDAVTPEKLSSRLDALFPDTFEVNGERRSDWQKIACALAARGNFSVITGGPGTGKTYAVARLLALLFATSGGQQSGLRVALAAPTGKAAARLKQSIDVALAGLDDRVRAVMPQRELGAARPGDEPLVSVDDPLVAILVRVGANERGVAACHFGFGHRKARTRGAFAQRAQVLFLLLGRCPMQQRVLVAFVGRLGVQDERADSDLGRFCRHRRHRGRAQPHAAPLGRHVRQPQLLFVARLAAQLDDRLHHLFAVVLVDRFPARPHRFVHEAPHPHAHIFHFGRKREVDHVTSVPHHACECRSEPTLALP